MKKYRIAMMVGTTEEDNPDTIHWEQAGEFKAVLGLKGMVVDEEMVVAMRAAFDEGRDVLLRAEEE